MNWMKPGEDTQESLIQDFSLPVLGILVNAAVGDPTGVTAAVIPIIVKEVLRRVITPFTSKSESKRLYQWAKQAAEGIAQRLKDGEKFRKDGFVEEPATNNPNWEEVIESTLKKVMDTTEEPKIKFMANLTENVHFDQGLDIDTYRQILKDLDELSYRQLCIIRLITLYENQEVDIRSINNEEQIPQNERIRFYGIGKECEKLMDNHYIMGESIPRYREENDPFVSNPGSGWLTDYTKRLHLFVNLDEIQFKDIEKAFSIWNVRLKKGESDP